MKDKPIITFRGWAGHFCGSSSCQFKLNTLIEYQKIKIVVSSVGMMKSCWPKNSEFYKGEYEKINSNGFYETMAFHAYKDGKFWDADVSRQINFDSPWNYEKLDMEQEANDGHYKVIEEISDRLVKGDKFKNGSNYKNRQHHNDGKLKKCG